MAVPAEVSTLYRKLAADSGPLPAALQRRIAGLAFAGDDDELLEALVARADAPADLSARYARLSKARLRIAYLTRPGVSAEEIAGVLAAESRVTVLAALAKAQATPDAVFAALAEVMVGRRSAQLARELLESPRTPPAVLLEALAFATPARGDHLGWAVQVRLTGAVGRLDPATAATAVERLPGWVLHPLLGTAGLPGPVRLALVHKVLRPALAGRRTSWNVPPMPALLDSLLACEDLQLEVLTAVHGLLRHIPPLMMAADVVEDLARSLALRAGGLLDADVDEVTRTARLAELLSAADPGTTPERLAELAAAALTGADRSLAARLLANPATPVEAAVPLAGLPDSVTAARDAYHAQAGQPGADPLRIALAATHPHLLVPSHERGSQPQPPVAPLNSFDDPAAAAGQLIGPLREAALAEAAAEGPASAHMPAITALTAFTGDPLAGAAATDAALALPWPHLLVAVPRSLTSGPRKLAPAAATVTAALAEALADDEVRWDVFEALAAQFPGTAGDLIATITQVTDPV